MKQRKSAAKALPAGSRQGKGNTSFKAKSKSAKGKHRTQNQAGARSHFKTKAVVKKLEKPIRTSKLSSQAVKQAPEASSNLSHGVRHITVEAAFDGQRIDNYLRRILTGVPKSKLYKILRKGEVRLNKKRTKPEDRIYKGDILRIPPITLEDKSGLYIPHDAITAMKNGILYQDDSFMVINKPAGMAVHGGTKNSYGVIDVIRQAFPDNGWELCHRLDKDTSGCLVLANNRQALNEFQQLSIESQIHKQYLTLVKGNWLADELLIDTPLEKSVVSRMNAQGEFEQVVEGGSKEAISIFTAREYFAKTSLMQVVIKTGKTHQIRVHSALNKHPVAMDDKYGDFKWNRALEKIGLPRMFLHAHIIRFKPFGEIVHVSAPLADDLQQFIEQHC